MNERTSGLLVTAGYFTAFFALLIGLQHLQIAGLGGAAIPLTAVIIIFVILALITVLLRRDRASFDSIGITARKALPQFFVGLVAGLAVCALMIGSLLVLTPLAIGPATSGNTLPALSFAFFVIFLLGLMEEIVFRSYPIFKLDDLAGTRTAVYVTSVAFAFYHGLDASNLLGPGVWGLLRMDGAKDQQHRPADGLSRRAQLHAGTVRHEAEVRWRALGARNRAEGRPAGNRNAGVRASDLAVGHRGRAG